MPMTLEAIIQHVRSQNRPSTHQAALLRRIDELEGEVAAAVKRGMEAAAEIADVYETENFRLCTDSILTDPVLSGRDRSLEGCAVSERLQTEGLIHSSMAHAARNIAGAIREAAKETGDV